MIEFHSLEVQLAHWLFISTVVGGITHLFYNYAVVYRMAWRDHGRLSDIIKALFCVIGTVASFVYLTGVLSKTVAATAQLWHFAQ